MQINDIKGSMNFKKQSGQALPQPGASSAIDLLSQAILPKAAEIARAGKYQEAENLLEQLVQEGATLPALFDLLAKIRAQQGRLMEAQAYWVEAIHYDSTNNYYRGALKCIEYSQSHPMWIRNIGQALLCIGLICGTIGIIFAARLYWHDINILHIHTIQAVKRPEKPAIKQNAKQSVKQSVMNIFPQHPKHPTAIPGVTPPKISVEIPGVLVNTHGNQVIITFASGLFLHGTELLPESKTTLDLLAGQLRPFQGQIQVHVEGHTDNLPIFIDYQDNVSLGLHRAVAVVEYLRLKGQFPAEMFTASGLGESRSLYPNDTINNQLRNRTVIIRITKKADTI